MNGSDLGDVVEEEEDLGDLMAEILQDEKRKKEELAATLKREQEERKRCVQPLGVGGLSMWTREGAWKGKGPVLWGSLFCRQKLMSLCGCVVGVQGGGGGGAEGGRGGRREGQEEEEEEEQGTWAI